MTNMAEICRLCMCQDENMVSIFDEDDIASKITWVSQLNISQVDRLPGQICSRCSTRLNSAYFFKEQIISIDRTLREMLRTQHEESMIKEDGHPGSEFHPFSTDKSADQYLYQTAGSVKRRRIKRSCVNAQTNIKLEVDVVSIESDGESSSYTADQSIESPMNTSSSESTMRINDTLSLGESMPTVWKNTHTKLRRRRRGSNVKNKKFPCPHCNKLFTRKDHVKRHLPIHSVNKLRKRRGNYKKSSVGSSTDNLVIPLNIERELVADAQNQNLTEVRSAKITSHSSHENIGPSNFQEEAAAVTYNLDMSSQPVKKKRRKGQKLTPKNRSFQCPFCENIFYVKHDAEQHILDHLQSERDEGTPLQLDEFEPIILTPLPAKNLHPYKCNSCSKSFEHKEGLKKHVQTHLQEKLYPCRVCQKSFTKEGSVIRHLRFTHGIENPFSCVLCDAEYTDNRYLKLHLKIDHGEEQFCCATCRQSFAHRNDYVTHLMTHTSDNLYECSLCNETFDDESNRSKHLMTAH